MKTTTEVLKELQRRRGTRSIRDFAKEVGCSAAYMCDVFLGNRQPAKRILAYLGLERTRTVTVSYQPKTGKRVKP